MESTIENNEICCTAQTDDVKMTPIVVTMKNNFPTMKITITTMKCIIVNNAMGDGGRLAASGCVLWVSCQPFSDYLNSLFRDYSFVRLFLICGSQKTSNLHI
jgi:hypothetical protein